jgi:Ca2+-binding EF-hand superfamily protein
MTKRNKIILASSVALGVLVLAVFAGTGVAQMMHQKRVDKIHAAAGEDTSDGVYGGDHRGGFMKARYGRHGGGHHRGGRFFETFDTNEDGKLTQTEVDAARKDRFDKFDANKDGKLTLVEYEKLWLDAMRERMVDRFQHHDADGDASVTLGEFQKRFTKIVQRLDDDGDGIITRKELRDRFQRHREHRSR